ncbi:MAG: hypothetical protein F9K34_10275 [Albidovulum sp.]|nr:MAG: hypothetical protein F9K34_10275 [Defluviimonas sp.]
MRFTHGTVQLSDRIIFGLLAVAVFSPVNRNQTIPSSYYLTYGTVAEMPISEWWGRAHDFPQIAALDPIPSVRLDFMEWIERKR